VISTTSLLFNFINNLGIYVLLIAGYAALYPQLPRFTPLIRQIILGLFFSLFVPVAMQMHIPVANGIILDQRTTFILLSGFFGGPVSIAICGGTAALYRIHLGGSGTLWGCIGIVVSILSGSALYRLRERITTVRAAALASIIAAVLPLPTLFLALPAEQDWSHIVRTGILFCIIVYVSVFITGMLLTNEERRYAFKARLLLSEKKYRELFESLVNTTYLTKSDGICEIVSPSVEKICGYSPDELIGKPISLLFKVSATFNDYRTQLKRDGFIRNFETQLLRKDNSSFWASFDAQLVYKNSISTGEEGIFRDITSLKLKEEEKQRQELITRQNQKMESIGTLAGGIAHDFNNILAAIIGYSEMAQLKVTPENPLYQDISGILRSATRAKDLVRHILIFSRRTSYDSGPVDVYLMIKEVVKMIEASLPEGITIEQKIKYRSGVILADPTEIHQVLLNICTNSIEAIGDKSGVITISLEKKELTRMDLLGEPDIEPGSFISLSISDNGCGILPDHITRVFDPFFTTKEVGKGSGLGLSVVHGIVKRLGGFCTITSPPNSPTTVTVFLHEIPAVAKENYPINILPKGCEKILFVDDEPIVVDVTRKILENLGYHVTTFTSSEDALIHFQEHPEAFDLVITDQLMPKITGDQLSKAFLMIRPNLPIIMCTGFSVDVDAEKAKDIGIREYIMKPIEKKKLAELIRSVLDS